MKENAQVQLGATEKKMNPEIQRRQAEQVRPINSTWSRWSMTSIRCPSKGVMTISPLSVRTGFSEEGALGTENEVLFLK